MCENFSAIFICESELIINGLQFVHWSDPEGRHFAYFLISVIAALQQSNLLTDTELLKF